jgi:cytochrome c peroxidase
MHRKHYIVIIIFLAGFFACKKEVVEAFMGFQQPINFPTPAYRLANNNITQAGFELGRKLFYEPMLSADNTISCGTCHLQTSGFTQHGHNVSHGIAGRLGTRNSTPIMNLAWSNSFMWDGGVADLDLQPIVPITSLVEMDETVANVLQKLKNSNQYPTLFQNAFGSNEITSVRFLKALSQFMVMCVSSNSKYDSVMRKEPGVAFTNTEQEGYNLFKAKCASCHTEPLFTDNNFRNNGISISGVNDIGRGAITGNTTDNYKFKVPSLRNLEFTAPYMHDGRFLALDAVLDHYNNQVQNTPNLDPLLKQGTQLGIALSATEKVNILAFLKTLNDKAFITDKRFAEQ